MLHDNIRKSHARVSKNKRIFTKFSADPTFLYNGGCELYEDAADYVNIRTIRAVRIG
ncbi:hypothetical protein [Paenibacillus abyssi]|uniref:Uncharacterized protein n=1 Tax=Paenibacillus abyssi TaxID=1340531 RepID=A0A917FLH8_9BACL|nr:hypothetical protein [Paenibacillus abyssi]GGF88101.1 hypothetical protein GCM10010916_01750 [Paenibacillus abyssi]